MLWRNFRARDDNSKVLFAKDPPFGQTNFERAQRTIAGILKLIDDVQMDVARLRAGNANLRLPIVKMEARAKGLDATRREKCPRAQSNRKKDARP